MNEKLEFAKLQLSKLQISSDYRFQWEEAQQCFVLLYPEGMIQLSPTAGEILQRCQQQTSIDDLLKSLQDKFPDVDELVTDVLVFIIDAEQQGWLERETQEA